MTMSMTVMKREDTTTTVAEIGLDVGHHDADQRPLLDPHAAHRFWDNVAVDAPDACWPWVGRGTREASGHVRIWHQGRKVYAHRLAYLLAGGELTDDDVCRHAVCDRPDCMNYLHMRAGTSAENTRDREQRNRRTPFLPRGEAHWSAKLSDADAGRIRAAKQLGLDAKALAAMFGVSRSTVYNIWAGVHYPSTGARAGGRATG